MKKIITSWNGSLASWKKHQARLAEAIERKTQEERANVRRSVALATYARKARITWAERELHPEW